MSSSHPTFSGNAAEHVSMESWDAETIRRYGHVHFPHQVARTQPTKFHKIIVMFGLYAKRHWLGPTNGCHIVHGFQCLSVGYLPWPGAAKRPSECTEKTKKLRGQRWKAGAAGKLVVKLAMVGFAKSNVWFRGHVPLAGWHWNERPKWARTPQVCRHWMVTIPQFSIDDSWCFHVWARYFKILQTLPNGERMPSMVGPWHPNGSKKNCPLVNSHIPMENHHV